MFGCQTFFYLFFLQKIYDDKKSSILFTFSWGGEKNYKFEFFYVKPVTNVILKLKTILTPIANHIKKKKNGNQVLD